MRLILFNLDSESCGGGRHPDPLEWLDEFQDDSSIHSCSGDDDTDSYEEGSKRCHAREDPAIAEQSSQSNLFLQQRQFMQW